MIVGIRPEDFEDARLAPENRRHGVEFEAPIEVLESMGSEIYAYFSFEGDEVSSDELAELARDSGAADVPGAGANRAVARLNPESDIGEGSGARLWFDAAKLHVFDPHDGTNLAHKAAAKDESSSIAAAEGDDGAPAARPAATGGAAAKPAAAKPAAATPPDDADAVRRPPAKDAQGDPDAGPPAAE